MLFGARVASNSHLSASKTKKRSQSRGALFYALKIPYLLLKIRYADRPGTYVSADRSPDHVLRQGLRVFLPQRAAVLNVLLQQRVVQT